MSAVMAKRQDSDTQGGIEGNIEVLAQAEGQDRY